MSLYISTSRSSWQHLRLQHCIIGWKYLKSLELNEPFPSPNLPVWCVVLCSRIWCDSFLPLCIEAHWTVIFLKLYTHLCHGVLLISVSIDSKTTHFTPLWNMTPVWSFPFCLSWTDQFFSWKCNQKTDCTTSCLTWASSFGLCLHLHIHHLLAQSDYFVHNVFFDVVGYLCDFSPKRSDRRSRVSRDVCVMWCKEVYVVLPQALFCFMFAVFFKLWKCAF